MKLTVIIPARNEKYTIIKTLNSLQKYVKTPHRVLVVDDSNDGTTQVVTNYIRKHKNVYLIRGNPKKKSFARALRMGFKKVVSGTVVVVMADLCDDPRVIDKMYEKIKEGWDVICGSRYMKGGKKIGGPKIQSLFSFLVCRFVKMFIRIPTSDVSNAFKMYRLSALKGVRFNLLSGVEASMEIALRLFFKGARITEIPTVWIGRQAGESKFKILHRTPKYARIIFWSLESSLRKSLDLDFKKYASVRK